MYKFCGNRWNMHLWLGGWSPWLWGPENEHCQTSDTPVIHKYLFWCFQPAKSFQVFLLATLVDIHQMCVIVAKRFESQRRVSGVNRLVDFGDGVQNYEDPNSILWGPIFNTMKTQIQNYEDPNSKLWRPKFKTTKTEIQNYKDRNSKLDGKEAGWHWQNSTATQQEMYRNKWS